MDINSLNDALLNFLIAMGPCPLLAPRYIARGGADNKDLC